MRSVLIAVLVTFAFACGQQEQAADNPDAAGKNPTVSETAPSTVSNTAPPSGIGNAPSACELVTSNDLERITGMKFAPGVTVTHERQLDRCGFEQATGGAGGVTVALYVENVADPGTAFQITPDMQVASGVGDSAYWSPSQRAFITRKDNRVIIVAFKSEGGNQQRLAAEIARQALERM